MTVATVVDGLRSGDNKAWRKVECPLLDEINDTYQHCTRLVEPILREAAEEVTKKLEHIKWLKQTYEVTNVVGITVTAFWGTPDHKPTRYQFVFSTPDGEVALYFLLPSETEPPLAELWIAERPNFEDIQLILWAFQRKLDQILELNQQSSAPPPKPKRAQGLFWWFVDICLRLWLGLAALVALGVAIASRSP